LDFPVTSAMFEKMILVLLFLPLAAAGQQVVLNNNTTFANGIYTSIGELAANKPRYLKCELDIVTPPVGLLKYYYYDSLHVRHTYFDSCFAVVSRDALFVRRMNEFLKSYHLGAITVLFSSD
jgi:hypothetical protein